MRSDAVAPRGLIITCEHASPRVPRAHADLFTGAEAVLQSHQGWDPGALPLARLIAKRLQAPLLLARWSRLLVESNRSPTNPRIWSRFTRELPREARQRILDRYWRPHREAVEQSISAAIGRDERVVHVAVHSFAPVIDGEIRTADVGLLYDSRRSREAAFARQWAERLRHHAPGLRLRLNYPYLGKTDGLVTWLRRQHAVSRYLGFELEINQSVSTGPNWRKVGAALAASLGEALVAAARVPRKPARTGKSQPSRQRNKR